MRISVFLILTLSTLFSGVVQGQVVREGLEIPPHVLPTSTDAQILEAVQIAVQQSKGGPPTSVHLLFDRDRMGVQVDRSNSSDAFVCFLRSDSVQCDPGSVGQDARVYTVHVPFPADELPATVDAGWEMGWGSWLIVAVVGTYAVKKVLRKWFTGRFLASDTNHSHFFQTSQEMRNGFDRDRDHLDRLLTQALEGVNADLLEVGLALARSAGQCPSEAHTHARHAENHSHEGPGHSHNRHHSHDNDSHGHGHGPGPGHHSRGADTLHSHGDNPTHGVHAGCTAGAEQEGARAALLHDLPRFALTLGYDFYSETLKPLFGLIGAMARTHTRDQLFKFLDHITVRTVQERGVAPAVVTGIATGVGLAAAETLESTVLGAAHVACQVGTVVVLGAVTAGYTAYYCARHMNALPGLTWGERVRTTLQFMQAQRLAIGVESQSTDVLMKQTERRQIFLAMSLIYKYVDRLALTARKLHWISGGEARRLARELGALKEELNQFSLALTAQDINAHAAPSIPEERLHQWIERLSAIHQQLVPQATRDHHCRRSLEAS
ncbi:MAG: hypothetical protein AB7G93_05925 [Bdellovibrionales bacterium]